MKYIVLSLLVLVSVRTLAIEASDTSNDLAGLWEQAGYAYQQEDYASAAIQYLKWIERAKENNAPSPESHFNLGLSLFATGDYAQSVGHLTQSMRLGFSPYRISKGNQLLTRIQTKLGISKPATETTNFQLLAILTPDIRWLLTSIAAWSLALLAVSGWVFKKHIPKGIQRLNWAIIVSLVLMGGWIYSIVYQSKYAVIASGDQLAPLYTGASAEEKLIDLPSGVIVTIGESRDNLVRIVEPVAAWVSRDLLVPL